MTTRPESLLWWRKRRLIRLVHQSSVPGSEEGFTASWLRRHFVQTRLTAQRSQGY